MTVQNYYTKSRLAKNIATRLDSSFRWVKSILDLCAGTGQLTNPFYNSLSHHDATLTFVEPDPDAIPSLVRWINHKHHRGTIHQMTAEEYALTYAAPQSHEIVFCNPPFGSRTGRTQLDELVTDLHLPHIQSFEAYFLTLAARLASRAMIFLIPESFFRKADAKQTLEQVLHSQWQLEWAYELPIDGFEHSMVRTLVLCFKYSDSPSDWVDSFLDQAQRQILPPLHRQVERDTHSHRFGPIEGYLLPQEPADTFDLNHHLISANDTVQCNPDKAVSWHPQPRQLGDHWTRMGCVYELTESGWVPAQGGGYLDGQPVSEKLDIARSAFDLLKQGAINSAAHLVRDVDCASLAQDYAELPSSSFLTLLPPGRADATSLRQELQALGMIRIKPPTLDAFDVNGLVIREPYLFDPNALTPVHRAQLFQENLLIKEEFQDFYKELNTVTIPVSQLELRSSWIPKTLIANYLGVSVSDNGLYQHATSHRMNRLLAYLNFGKAGPIREGDQAIYEVMSQDFALAMQDWSSRRHRTLRVHLHIAYLMTRRSHASYATSVDDLKPAFPLHDYQRRDLPFALSGATILNWDVGLGKTFGGIAAAIAHPGKTLIAVPKPVIAKWAREIDTFFPGTVYRVLGFRRNKKGRYVRDSKGLVDQVRQGFFSPNIKILLTTHEVLCQLQISDRDQRDADIQDAQDRVGSRDLRTHNLRREQHIQHAASRNFLYGGPLTFSDLPLAGMLLVVDEGHQFKSLFPMPSRGWGQSLIMAGNCGMSKRARDLKIKCDLIREAGGKTLCLTATPISNSVAEIFNMLRIFAPHTLAKRGIANTQQLIDTYCTLERITTVSVTGKVLSGQTIAGFRNVKDLKAMWDEAMITRTAAEVKLPLPKVEEQVMRIQPTPELAQFIHQQKADLQQDHLDEDGIRRKQCMFQVIGTLDKVAMFPPSLDLNTNPKGDRLVNQVWRIDQRNTGGQIIFSDQLESQEGLRSMLIDQGLDPEVIELINAQTAPRIEERLAIQDRFNAGTTRIVIGGQLASEGIDLQKNAVAIHFNNLCWHGQAIHQRKGRAVRQGNPNAKVEVFYYLLEGTTDIYRFATIQTKTHWWESLRTSQTDSVKSNVFSDPVPDELVASLAADPESMLAELTQLRRTEEINQDISAFQGLLHQMGRLLDPNQSLPIAILRHLEEKIRRLRWIEKRFVDEGIRRVQQIAELQHTFGSHRLHEPWEDRFQERLTRFFEGATYVSVSQALELTRGEDDQLAWGLSLDGLIPFFAEKLGTYPTTFLEIQPVADQWTASENPSSDVAEIKVPKVHPVQVDLFPIVPSPQIILSPIRISSWPSHAVQLSLF